MWHRYLLGILFAIAGIFHFIKPKAYLRIMPLYLPFHLALVYLSGAVEIAAGIGLCLPNSYHIASWVIILLLIAFFPVHIYMITETKASLGLPKFVLYLRLALQVGLIYWAFQYV